LRLLRFFALSFLFASFEFFVPDVPSVHRTAKMSPAKRNVLPARREKMDVPEAKRDVAAVGVAEKHVVGAFELLAHGTTPPNLSDPASAGGQNQWFLNEASKPGFRLLDCFDVARATFSPDLNHSVEQNIAAYRPHEVVRAGLASGPEGRNDLPCGFGIDFLEINTGSAKRALERVEARQILRIGVTSRFDGAHDFRLQFQALLELWETG
jgi:hypothetical protein